MLVYKEHLLFNMHGVNINIEITLCFKCTVTCHVTVCIFVDTYQRFRRRSCLCLQRDHCKKRKEYSN